ncbi:hypothetical protein EG329_013409 [Mollisiaceae sp. DMI_Dod_QoI]|nr:hypothetical protein EG329_013409 [Helotiales sp. DMI_Dod_QoI]
MEDSTPAQPTMRCNICAKTFDNRKSQLRHSSYCRKAKSRITSRKKACAACTKAKARCDAIYSTCSRCLAKKLACDYGPSLLLGGLDSSSGAPSDQTVAPDSSIPQIFDSIQSSMQLVATGTAPSYPNRNSNSASMDLESADPLESCGLVNLEDVPPQAENAILKQVNATGMIFSDLVEYSTAMPLISGMLGLASPQHLGNDYAQTYAYATPNNELNSRGFPIISESSMSGLEITQIVFKSPKAFSPRSFHNRQLLLNRNFVLCTLRSYPSMILLDRDPPPFIHRYDVLGMDKSGNKTSAHKFPPAPLQNCAAILRWYNMKSRDNVIHIWRTIRMEQERLLAEYSYYSDKDTLAALQAIAIYLLLRVSEDNDEATDFDLPLIHTMLKLCIRMHDLSVINDNLFEANNSTWQAWILAESLRR